MALLAQAVDLHEFQASVPPDGLKRIGPSTDDDRRLRGMTAVDDGAGPFGGTRSLDPRLAERTGKDHMGALERSEHAGPQRRRRRAQRVNHLVGALVPLPALAEA